MPFSRGTSRPWNQTHVSCIAGRFFIDWATWEALHDLEEDANAAWWGLWNEKCPGSSDGCSRLLYQLLPKGCIGMALVAFVDLTNSDHGEKKDPEARKKKKQNLNKVHFLSLLSLYSHTAGKKGSRVSQVKDTQNPVKSISGCQPPEIHPMAIVAPRVETGWWWVSWAPARGGWSKLRLWVAHGKVWGDPVRLWALRLEPEKVTMYETGISPQYFWEKTKKQGLEHFAPQNYL